MKKNLEPNINFLAENASKLPGIRKYLAISENTALQDTIAFLARKNKSNDIFIKTLLSPALEKEDDRLYYKSLLTTCLKSLISQKKRKISSRSSVKVMSWMEAAEEVMFTLSTTGNFRELWLLCKNIQYQFCEWTNYEDITNQYIGDFMKKTQEYIELCFNETPAAQMKFEILHFESEILINLDFPIISAEKNPILFLIQYNQHRENEQTVQKYIEKRRKNPLSDSREKNYLDQAEFLLNLRYSDENYAIKKLLAGHNEYDNIKFLVNYCIENTHKFLAEVCIVNILSTQLNTSFLEENILKLYHSNLIDQKVLSLSYLKLFLLNGHSDYLEKTVQAGYGYQIIIEHLESFSLVRHDLRYIQTYLTFGKYDILEAELADPLFYTEVINNLKNFRLNQEVLKLLISFSINYLQNFVGPKSHEVIEILARYLKRENYSSLLKNLKDHVRKNFPERKFLLKQI